MTTENLLFVGVIRNILSNKCKENPLNPLAINMQMISLKHEKMHFLIICEESHYDLIPEGLQGAKPVETLGNQVSFDCKDILMKDEVTKNQFSQLRPRASNDKK